ncbi:MAG: hypothetical protein ACPG49_14295 [Chitinophagales bacterium]
MKNSCLLLALSAFMSINFFSIQTIQAQSTPSGIVKTDKIAKSGFFEVNVTNFLFKKIDDNNKIISFTEADAEMLNAFFEVEEAVISVESHVIDKSVRVLSLLQKDGTSLFEYKKFVDMLDELGYVVTRLHCQTEKQYIASTIPKNENRLVVQLTNNGESECSDCANVKISKEDLELFKNMDYGGSVIELDLGGTTDMN